MDEFANSLNSGLIWIFAAVGGVASAISLYDRFNGKHNINSNKEEQRTADAKREIVNTFPRLDSRELFEWNPENFEVAGTFENKAYQYYLGLSAFWQMGFLVNPRAIRSQSKGQLLQTRLITFIFAGSAAFAGTTAVFQGSNLLERIIGVLVVALVPIIFRITRTARQNASKAFAISQEYITYLEKRDIRFGYQFTRPKGHGRDS